MNGHKSICMSYTPPSVRDFHLLSLRIVTFPHQLLFYTQEKTLSHVPVNMSSSFVASLMFSYVSWVTRIRKRAQGNTMMSCTSQQLFHKRGIQVGSWQANRTWIGGKGFIKERGVWTKALGVGNPRHIWRPMKYTTWITGLVNLKSWIAYKNAKRMD